MEHEERSEKMMNDWCSEIDRNLQDVQTQNRFLICFDYNQIFVIPHIFQGESIRHNVPSITI